MPAVIETAKDTDKFASPLADPQNFSEQESGSASQIYSDDERTYLSALQSRLEGARLLRDTAREEFDGMDYVTQWVQNERIANTYIEPKKNPEDSTFQSGTGRDKLFAILSSLNNFDLSPDITAFDDDNFPVQHLGDGMEMIVEKTEELEGDDEKKMLRQYELLKHGSVFVEEGWVERWMKSKKMEIFGFDGKASGPKRWKTLLKKLGGPERSILPGIYVYLGNIRQYFIEKQPYIYTVELIPYDDAKSMYGRWERWKYVRRNAPKLATAQPTIYDNTWSLLPTKDGMVEVIKYQDKWNNEFQIILNSVLMMPIGYPLSAVSPSGEYTIVQQNGEPIRSNFAYGKGLMQRIKSGVSLLDEMYRLSVLKTQKSYQPPTINNTGRVLSRRVFMPGKVTMGIAPGSVQPLMPDQAEGVTRAEFAFMQDLKRNIDQHTVSPQFAGQPGQQKQTATEVLELQRQAKLILGYTVAAAALLEHKLTWLRIFNILAHWFSPIDTVVDDVRDQLKNVYRSVTVERNIPGEGAGQRIIKVSPEIPTPKEIFEEEERYTRVTGVPVRVMYLNPEEMNTAKYQWQIAIKPKEKKTSELARLMFRGMVQDAVGFFGPRVDLDYLGEQFAANWNVDPSKLFRKPEAQGAILPPPGQPAQQGGGPQSPAVRPAAPVLAAAEMTP